LGRGLDLPFIKALNEFAVGMCKPDRTFLLDLDVAVSRARQLRRGPSVGQQDRMERLSDEFFEKVRRGYLEIARAEPERVKLLTLPGLRPSGRSNLERNRWRSSLEQALGYLTEANAQGRLAHSFLFSGPEGSGKRRLVAELFRVVNGNTAMPLIFTALSPNPSPEEFSSNQIRELEASLRMHASRARMKFGVVYEADRLMAQAANAFLKTLEEPPDHSVLILVTALPEALLDTIRSRCIEVSLRAPGARAPTAEEAELVGELYRIVASDGFPSGRL